MDGTSKVAAHAVLGAAVTTLLGTGWQTGAAAGALGDLLPQALEKAFEKDENGRIKNEEAFKAANTIISAALTSATGGDIANTINAGMVTQNAVENNWLSHQRPSAAQLAVLFYLRFICPLIHPALLVCMLAIIKGEYVFFKQHRDCRP